MNIRKLLSKDRIGGLLLILLGIGVIIMGNGYNIGSLTRMGPGFMPVVYGILLVVLGLVLLLSTLGDAMGELPEMPDIRGVVCILLGVVAFVVLGEYGGLVPATFAAVFIPAMGDRKNSVRDAALLSAGLVVAAILIFHWGLQMQFPLFTWGN